MMHDFPTAFTPCIYCICTGNLEKLKMNPHRRCRCGIDIRAFYILHIQLPRGIIK